MLNLVCRDPDLREATVAVLREVFASVLSYRVPEEVNEVLFCARERLFTGKRVDAGHPMIAAFRAVNATVRDESFVDLADAVRQLKVM